MSPTRSPAPARRLTTLLRALVSLLVLVALLAGPPALLLAIGRLPEGPPTADDLWETRLEDVLPTLLTLACWALWAWWVWCVVAEAAVAFRRAPRPVRAPRRPGPRGLAATLLGGILLLPAAQAGASSPAAAAVPISDAIVPETPEHGQQAAAVRAAQGHPTHTAGPGNDTVWDISERYFPGQPNRYAEIRELNAQLGNPLPDGVALPAGQLVFLPYDAHQPGAAVQPVSAVADDTVGAEPLLTITEPGWTVDDVAREHMGDAGRAGDIAALNPGLEADQGPDGTLRPGTVLAMPSDYTPPAQPEERAGEESAAPEDAERADGEQAAERGTAQVTVEPGDTLWALSREHLDDPTRFPEIYEDNREVIGDDPNLIRPGQELTIEDSLLATPEAETPPEVPEEAPDPAPEEEPAPEQQLDPDSSEDGEGAASGGAAETPDQDRGEEREESADPSPGASASPGNGEADAADAADRAETPAEDEASVPASVLALGTAGVLAAGTLGLVARRRMLQQRRRRLGHRIPKPAGSAATTEQALRYVEVGDQVAHLRRALLTAAANLAAAGRELPVLAAVTLTPRGATLHLAEPAAVVQPFAPADDTDSAVAARRWHVAAGSRQVRADDDLGDIEAPYPALVTIGRDDDGALVLVDLERVGAVQLTGDRRRQMLRTLAAELAVSELADDLELALVGTLVAPNLERLGVDGRITRYDGVAAAVPVLRAQYRDQQAAMTAVGADHLRQARLSPELDGAWEPLLILADSTFTDDADADVALNDLLEMVSTGPRAAAAVVTSGMPKDDDSPQPDGVWVLSTEPGAPVVVPGTDLRITLEPLADEDYADLVEIATTALSEMDVPAPERPAPAVPAPPAPAGEDLMEGSAEDDGEEESRRVAPEPAAGPGDVTGLALMGSLASFDTPAADPDGDADEGEPPLSAPSAPAAVPVVDFGKLADGGEPPVDEDSDADGLVPWPPSPRAPLPADQADGPMIRVLGPVDITGARGKVESARRRSLLEAAAWIALHPDAPRRAMDEALWPWVEEVNRNHRNPLISKLRAWLGRDDAGELYMPRGLYEFSDGVRCDWHIFQDLAAAARRTSGPDAEGLLHEALTLVRGRPFAGIDPRKYVWAEHDAQDMISAIVDAATELAEYHLESGAPRAALWAATKGLEVAEESERLHRITFRAHHALGDREGLERAAARLDALLAAWQVDMEESTARLLGELLNRRPAGSRR